MCGVPQGSILGQLLYLMDENLTWKHHLDHINIKISRALFIKIQVNNFLPVESVRTLYFTN